DANEIIVHEIYRQHVRIWKQRMDASGIKPDPKASNDYGTGISKLAISTEEKSNISGVPKIRVCRGRIMRPVTAWDGAGNRFWSWLAISYCLRPSAGRRPYQSRF